MEVTTGLFNNLKEDIFSETKNLVFQRRKYYICANENFSLDFIN